MQSSIKYAADGTRTYFLEGVEVSEAAYQAASPSRLAELLDGSGRLPYIVTDSVFMNGNLGEQQLDRMTVEVRQKYLDAAQRAGVDVRGKRFYPSLAKKFADPNAWLDGRGEVAARARQENLNAEGLVNVQADGRPAKKPRRIPLAKSMVSKLMKEEIARHGDVRAVNLPELREQVIDKHAFKYKDEA